MQHLFSMPWMAKTNIYCLIDVPIPNRAVKPFGGVVKSMLL